MKHLTTFLIGVFSILFAPFLTHAQQSIILPTTYFCHSGVLDAGCGYNAFLWSTNDSTQTIMVNQTDTFTVEVTDNNGFSYLKKFPVVINGPIVSSISTEETCDSNGVVRVDSIIGVAPFSFQWNTGATTDSIAGLGAGIYTVTITDANGCTIVASDTVNTSMYCSSLPCGLVFDNMNTYTSATAVAGSQGYLVSFYDPSNLNTPVTTHTYPGNNPRTYFNQLSGLLYDQTYIWTVKVVYLDGNGALQTGPESSKSCSITFTKPVGLVPCGITYNHMNRYKSVLNSVGSAGLYQSKGYEVAFYLPSDTNNAVETHVYPENNPRTFFNQLDSLHYNQTYIWTVKVWYLDTDSTTILKGPESSKNCSITFEKPVGVVPCGSTFNTLNTYTSVLNTAGSAGLYQAQEYLVQFYDPSDTTVVVGQATYPGSNPRTYFNQVTPTLSNNHTYIWTVKVRYLDINGNLQFGPESSKTCTIIFDPTATPNLNTNSNGNVGHQSSTIDDNLVSIQDLKQDPTIKTYPNPVQNGILKIDVDGTKQSSPVDLQLINLKGKVVQILKNVGETKFYDVSRLSPGVYFLSGMIEGVPYQSKIVIQ